jgi:hypothetical protein
MTKKKTVEPTETPEPTAAENPAPAQEPEKEPEQAQEATAEPAQSPEEPEQPAERIEKDADGKEIKRTVPYTRELPCDLSDHEILSKAFLLTKAMSRDDLLHSLFKKIQGKWKEKFEGSTINIAKIKTMITERRENRTVQCETVFDYISGTVTAYRTDTYEKIESRIMTDEERQRAFDFGENDPDKELEEAAEEDAPPDDSEELTDEVPEGDLPPEDDEEDLDVEDDEGDLDVEDDEGDDEA